MDSILKTVSVIIIVISTFSCAPKSSEDSDNVGASTQAGLAIVGTWVADTYVGYYENTMNERQTVSLDSSSLRINDWQMETNLDPQGNGILKTKIHCKPSGRIQGRAVTGIPAPRSLSLFPDALKLRLCDNGQPVDHHQNHVLTAIDDKNIPKHIGTDGRANSILDTCRTLRGLRFIQQTTHQLWRAGSVGCIGFSDSKATQLALLLLPVGQINTVRINLKRIK